MLIADWLVALALFVASLNPQPPEPEPAPPPPACVFEDAQLTEAQMREVLACAEWPAELVEDALAVARCESSWSPGAMNPSGARGLFQVMPVWFRHAGIDVEHWANPVANARVALRVTEYDVERGRDPWSQWSCSP